VCFFIRKQKVVLFSKYRENGWESDGSALITCKSQRDVLVYHHLNLHISSLNFHSFVDHICPYKLLRSNANASLTLLVQLFFISLFDKP
jgi:hypothetical protein